MPPICQPKSIWEFIIQWVTIGTKIMYFNESIEINLWSELKPACLSELLLYKCNQNHLINDLYGLVELWLLYAYSRSIPTILYFVTILVGHNGTAIASVAASWVSPFVLLYHISIKKGIKKRIKGTFPILSLSLNTKYRCFFMVLFLVKVSGLEYI